MLLFSVGVMFSLPGPGVHRDVQRLDEAGAARRDIDCHGVSALEMGCDIISLLSSVHVQEQEGACPHQAPFHGSTLSITGSSHQAFFWKTTVTLLS